MNREAEIFADVLERPEAERGRFLAQACGGDPALRAQVEALLAGANCAADGRFLERPLSRRAAAAPTEQPGDEMGWPTGGSAKAGRYRLVEKIGEGGCGVVWRAEQREPVRREVALKVIKLGMDTREVVARFEAERQALALMDHPGIAKVFDGGATEAGRPYFVMELVRGVPLTRYCDEQALPLRERLELFIQVCEAVQHAHQKGIIHRDLKPSNILVAPPDGSGATSSPALGTPKVIDFGIAKALPQLRDRLTEHTLQTAVQVVMGTPLYMSPEQAVPGTADIDTRADIYSLGVILYELLTGETPFDRQTLSNGDVDALRQRIRDMDPPRPSTRFRTLDGEARPAIARHRGTAPQHLDTLLRGDLDWIVMRCLEKDRARRYATANALAQDLRRHLNHEPVTARPPSAAYLLQKAVRRHRLAFAAAAAVAGTLVLGVVASTWQAVRAKRAEQVALRAEQEQAQLRATAQARELAARRRAYAADMKNAQHALQVDDLGRVRELLRQHEPEPGARDLRGWEWRYLWQASRGDSATLLSRKENAIHSVSLSPDGRHLAILDEGRTFWLRNLETGEETRLFDGVVRAVLLPRAPLTAALVVSGEAFSSHRAGNLAATERFGDAGTDHALQHVVVRNLETGSLLGTWPLAGPCVSLCVSADGRTLVTGSLGPRNRLVVWRLPDGAVLAEHAAPTNAERTWNILAVSPDLRLAAYAVPDRSIRVIELLSGRELWTARAGEHEVSAIAFSPDGNALAGGTQQSRSGSGGSAILVWDANTGRELGRFVGHNAYIRHVIFSSDGSRLYSAARDHTVRIWDVASRNLLRTLRGHERAVSHVLPLSPPMVASASSDRTVRLWNLDSPGSAPAEIILPARLLAWRFDTDSQSILSVDADGRFVRWHGSHFQLNELGAQVAAAGATRSEVHFARNAPRLATAGPDGTVSVWDLERHIRLRTLGTSAPLAFPVAFLGQGSRILVRTRNGSAGEGGLQEWDVTSGQKFRSWDCAANPEAAVSPDETFCLVRDVAGGTSRIDLVSGRRSPLGVRLHAGYPLAFSPDGRFVAAPDQRNAEPPLVWDLGDLKPIARLTGVFFGANSATYSPDGVRLALGGGGGTEAITLRETETYQPLLSLEGRGTLFQISAFSPDGNTIGSLTYKGTLHLWRAPTWTEIAAAEQAQRGAAGR